MDKIQKALRKLTLAERKQVKEILSKLKNRQLESLNLKKLKGRDDVFRIRLGHVRVIYRIGRRATIFVLAIEKRSDTTYNL